MRRFRLAVWLALALAVAGCGGGDGDGGDQAAAGSDRDKPANLTYWATENDQEIATIKQIVAACQQQLPNIKVTVQQQAFEGAQQKFATAAQGGSAPDIMRSEVAWVADYASQGFLRPLDEYVSEQDKSDYLPSALAYDQYEGKLWGVPQVTDALALLYNKRLLQEQGITQPPATMDEFKAAVEKFNDGKTFGFYMRGDSYWLQPFIWAYGGGLVDVNNKQILVNNPQSVQGVQFAADLVESPGVVKNRDFANDYDNAMTAFKSGKVAMIFNGPWSTTDVLSGKEFSDKSNLGIAPIPSGPGGQGSPVGGHNYTIYAGTKAPDQSYAFIECMNSAENQALLAEKHNLLPTRKSAYGNAKVTGNPLVAGFQGVMEKATARPVHPAGGAIYTEFTPAWQQVYAGKSTPQEAMDKVAAAWQELYQF
jgi:arabinogalactan oligomer/maltooligosaccharide transport system substrate-binding protein